MSKDSLRIPDYVDHLLQALRRIERYTETMDETMFLEDQKTQDAVIRNIEILGEAAANIRDADPEFVERHSHVPWRTIRAMRNRVSHGYFEIDLSIVWKTIKNDLPALERQISALVAERRTDS